MPMASSDPSLEGKREAEKFLPISLEPGEKSANFIIPDAGTIQRHAWKKKRGRKGNG